MTAVGLSASSDHSLIFPVKASVFLFDIRFLAASLCFVLFVMCLERREGGIVVYLSAEPSVSRATLAARMSEERLLILGTEKKTTKLWARKPDNHKIIAHRITR